MNNIDQLRIPGPLKLKKSVLSIDQDVERGCWTVKWSTQPSEGFDGLEWTIWSSVSTCSRRIVQSYQHFIKDKYLNNFLGIIYQKCIWLSLDKAFCYSLSKSCDKRWHWFPNTFNKICTLSNLRIVVDALAWLPFNCLTYNAHVDTHNIRVIEGLGKPLFLSLLRLSRKIKRQVTSLTQQ